MFSRFFAAQLSLKPGRTEYEWITFAEEEARDILRKYAPCVRAIEAELIEKEDITDVRARELLIASSP